MDSIGFTKKKKKSKGPTKAQVLQPQWAHPEEAGGLPVNTQQFSVVLGLGLKVR